MFKKVSPCRAQWLEYMHKIAYPVISFAAQGKLKQALPLTKGEKSRSVACLEAVGRTVAGLAPWLELNEKELENEKERELQQKYRALVRSAMANSVNPKSEGYCVWNKTGEHLLPDQPIVDAAYFASAILKAPTELWQKQPDDVKNNILLAFEKVLLMRPHRSNWLMFTAIIETCKHKLTGFCDLMRVDYALVKHNDWYKGDGAYGDGEHFAWDYYNSFVIQPMLEEVAFFLGGLLDKKLTENIIPRIKRYAEIQERFIAPDGTYPFIGRSITYRMAAFYALAHCAYRRILPPTLKNGQVRCALNKVITKAMQAPTLFDEQGFLTKGLYGKQENLTNYYTNTGSLYICLLVFLPLGLSASDAFWTSADEQTTWEKAWSGKDVYADNALES
jgi:hypothetical protein